MTQLENRSCATAVGGVIMVLNSSSFLSLENEKKTGKKGEDAVLAINSTDIRRLSKRKRPAKYAMKIATRRHQAE